MGRILFRNTNQWDLQSLPNKYNRMSLEEIRELYSSSLFSNISFRGNMFELLNHKAHEFLRILSEMGKYGERFKGSSVSLKRLRCQHGPKLTSLMINNFKGIYSSSKSEIKCCCDSDQMINRVPFFRDFLRHILKKDYISDDQTLQKFVDLLIIERFSKAEIIGIMSIISAMLH